MTRSLLVAAAIASVALGVRPGAQTRPDFSGKWTLANPGDDGVFGQSFTATQNATTLTIESTDPARKKSDAAPATASQPAPTSLSFNVAASVPSPQRWIYSMTAEETSMTRPRPAWVDSADQSRMMWSYIERSTERAVWQGDLLVVVSHAYYRTHWPQHEPAEFPTETTTRVSLSLEATNRLMAERTVIADPLPSHVGVRVDVPTVRRSVYAKLPQSDGGR